MECSIDSNKLITKFRVIVLLFSTVLFLFTKNQTYSFWNNFIVIMCLFMSNALLIYIYKDKTLTENKIVLFIFIEAFGIMFILIYSGAIYSYYFWMLLNPIITSLIKLKDEKRKKLITLILIVIVTLLLILNNKYVEIYDISSNNIIFGLFITMLFSSIISKVLEEQEIVKNDLENSKMELEKNIEVNKEITTNIINSIELIERLSIVEDYDQMIEIIIDFLNSVIKKGKSFFAVKKEDTEIVIYGVLSKEEVNSIRALLEQTDSDKEIKQINIDNNTNLIFNSVEYRGISNYFGILISNEYSIADIVKQQLLFIQKTYKIILSKMKLQEFRKELIISEEQNRIAEEMHDNVNQQIFATSCLAFNIKQQIEDNDKCEKILIEMIEQLYNSLKKINKDIRNIVYRMSLEKENKENIIINLDKYIDELSFIYNVKINHTITEKFISFNTNIRNAIFRILNESISNSVRHGKADNINIIITASNETIDIEINDTGIGFDTNNLNPKKRGLGIYSMKKLSETNKGTFEIISELNKGTRIKIKLFME